MTSRPNLIYDVGVCNGDDSAYYLHKGYRVVGIEANPLLLASIRRRFRSEIADGRYELEVNRLLELSTDLSDWYDIHAGGEPTR